MENKVSNIKANRDKESKDYEDLIKKEDNANDNPYYEDSQCFLNEDKENYGDYHKSYYNYNNNYENRSEDKNVVEVTFSGDYLYLIENLKNIISEDINNIYKNKKDAVYKYILKNYEILTDVEDKIEQEKLALELALSEKIIFEKLNFEEELKSKIT